MRNCMLHVAAFVAALGLTTRAPAQPDPEPKDGRVTIPVTLTPHTYPKPASRAYLLPEYTEAIPGNRVQMFLRCFMEQDTFFGRAETDRREKWNVMPLKDLPLAEVKNYGGRLIEKDMYDAARMTNVDWQLWYFVRRDGYYTLLPDVQKMRAQAAAMKTRVRGEIAAGEFPAAIHTLKTMFALARTLEAHPTLIGELVGIAIASIGVSAVEEFIQQSGAPNLYWALTDLPTPLISLRMGLEGERMFVSTDFETLKSSPDPVADAVVWKKIDGYAEILKFEEGQKDKDEIRKRVGAWKGNLQARAKDASDVQAARDRLVQAGLLPDHVKAWTPLHVVVLDEVVLYEQVRDEQGKWLNLPYWQAKPGMDQADAEFAKVKDKTPFLLLLPATLKVKQATTRLDQRVAYLQIMEAIRLHAHANGGSLPASLAETKLPRSVDPVTGKPFEYAVKDDLATLHGANPNPATERTNRYYEIRIKK